MIMGRMAGDSLWSIESQRVTSAIALSLVPITYILLFNSICLRFSIWIILPCKEGFVLVWSHSNLSYIQGRKALKAANAYYPNTITKQIYFHLKTNEFAKIFYNFGIGVIETIFRVFRTNSIGKLCILSCIILFLIVKRIKGHMFENYIYIGRSIKWYSWYSHMHSISEPAGLNHIIL